METKTERIHREFREALDISTIPAQKIEAGVDTMLESVLSNVGMTNSKTYKRVQSAGNTSRSVREVNILLESLRSVEATYPQYRIISLSKIMDLMAKYNLVFGGISDYIETIPEKNALELQNYEDTVARKVGVHSQRIDELFMSPQWSSWNYSKDQKYFMVAPEAFFNPKLKNVKGFMVDVGKEPKLEFKASMDAFSMKVQDTDPIILKRLNLPGKTILFHIVTAWDVESDDPEVSTKISEIARNEN